MSWRDKIDPSIKSHLELQIRETTRHKPAYSLAKDKAVSQLWCAIANLSKQNFDLNLKIKFLENALRELSQKREQEPIKKKSSRLEKSLKKF